MTMPTRAKPIVYSVKYRELRRFADGRIAYSVLRSDGVTVLRFTKLKGAAA